MALINRRYVSFVFVFFTPDFQNGDVLSRNGVGGGLRKKQQEQCCCVVLCCVYKYLTTIIRELIYSKRSIEIERAWKHTAPLTINPQSTLLEGFGEIP